MRLNTLFLIAALSLWFADRSLASVPEEGAGLTEQLRDEFAQLILLAPTEGPLETGAQLARLGPVVIPALFDAVRDGRLVVPRQDGTVSRMTLGDVHALALIEALRRLPEQAVVAHLRQLKAGGSSFADEERVASLVILSEIGSAKHLEVLFSLASPEASVKRASRRLRDAMEVALDRLVERDPAALDRIERVFSTAHASFVAPTVSVVARKPGTRRLAVLANLLGKVSEIDSLLLVEIGRMAARLPRPFEEPLLDRVRPFLFSSEEQLLVEATIASASMDDDRAVEPLIELLREPSANVRNAAVRGLRQLTGRQYGIDPDRWAAWFGREQEWWQWEAPAQFALIRGGSGTEASRVLLELSKKRLFRHRLTEFVGRGLERPELDLVVLTCASLGHLGSHTAVPLLVECLDRSQPEVQSAAWRALQRITALDLGPESALWKAAFPSSP